MLREIKTYKIDQWRAIPHSWIGRFIIYFFNYFWLCWVLVAACRLYLVVAGGGCCLVAVHRFLIAVASCCRAWALGHRIQ